MLVFLDFEASSLAKRSYPIEVAWVFEDGEEEAHLIRPAPDWTDWNAEAEDLHHIDRAMLAREGEPAERVAARMVARLSGHDLCASAPSWDGKWLSVLLRGAGLPRHSLRLRDSDTVHCECATRILAPVVPADRLTETVENLLTLVEVRSPGVPSAHRALADAREERQRWLAVGDAARRLAAEWNHRVGASFT